MSLIPFFCALILPSCLGWTQPINIGNGEPFVAPKSLYADPVSGILHLLVKHNHDDIMDYWQLSPEGKRLQKFVFSDPAMTDFEYGSIIGSEQNLYCTLVGGPDFASARVIAFAESSDYGKTWTKLVFLSGSNDDCDRTGAALLRVKETGRLYVFYHRLCGKDNETVAYVTRSPDSHVFAGEKTILSVGTSFPYMPNIAATYTYSNKRATLHLFFGEGPQLNESLWYTSSVDNGLRWSAATRPGKVGAPFGIFPIAAVAGSQLPEFVAAAYRDSTEFQYRICYSGDQGKTFSVLNVQRVGRMHSFPATRSHSAMMCGTPKTPLLFWLSENQDENTMLYGYWNLRTMTGGWQSHPFHEDANAMDVLLSCVTNEKDNEVVVSAFVFGKSGTRDRYPYFSQDKVKLE